MLVSLRIASFGHSPSHVPQLTHSSEITYAIIDILLLNCVLYVSPTRDSIPILIYLHKEYKYKFINKTEKFVIVDSIPIRIIIAERNEIFR